MFQTKVLHQWCKSFLGCRKRNQNSWSRAFVSNILFLGKPCVLLLHLQNNILWLLNLFFFSSMYICIFLRSIHIYSADSDLYILQIHPFSVPIILTFFRSISIYFQLYIFLWSILIYSSALYICIIQHYLNFRSIPMYYSTRFNLQIYIYICIYIYRS